MTTLEQIVEWASVLTGENRTGGEYYYVSEPVKRLEWSLTHVNRQLIALIGLQGTGKTSALYYLSEQLRKEVQSAPKKFGEPKYNVIIKWTENWAANLIQSELYDDLRKLVDSCIIRVIINEFVAHHETHRKHPFLKRVPDSQDITNEGAEQAYEQTNFQPELIIGKAKVKEATKEGLYTHLDLCRTIFIDLPDYTKTDRRLMSTHLSEVQALWEKLSKDKNIVVAIQKELFSGHFFFGKMDVVELTQLKPEEFLHVFKTEFPDCNLITDNAIILLGQLSRGVFRRFLKYLKLTCEKFAISNQPGPIDVPHVNEAVTVEQLTKDMELELYDIFKDANQRRQAVELLNHLRIAGPINQKAVAEFLNVSEATAGKIVNRLLTYRYVTRERGEGKEWVISLKI
jgi:hypothetical protein